MHAPPSSMLRAAVLMLMVVLAIVSLVAVAGRPDPLGEGRTLVFGLILIGWSRPGGAPAAVSGGCFGSAWAAGVVLVLATIGELAI